MIFSIQHEQKTYWECHYRRKPGPFGHCKGRAISELRDGKVTARMTAAHSHEPSAIKIASSEFRADLSSRAVQTSEATESVIRSVASHTMPEVRIDSELFDLEFNIVVPKNRRNSKSSRRSSRMI